MSRSVYQGKTVVVVDGSTKLGKKCIEAFARQGANIVANFPAEDTSSQVFVYSR